MIASASGSGGASTAGTGAGAGSGPSTVSTPLQVAGLTHGRLFLPKRYPNTVPELTLDTTLVPLGPGELIEDVVTQARARGVRCTAIARRVISFCMSQQPEYDFKVLRSFAWVRVHCALRMVQPGFVPWSKAWTAFCSISEQVGDTRVAKGRKVPGGP